MWRGSVFPVQGRLYLQVKDEGGRWRQRAPFPGEPLADTPENRVRAERRLGEIRSAMLALEEATGGDGGPLTVERWAIRWFKTRDVADLENDRARLRLHVYPHIGAMRLDEVEPRHVNAMAQAWKAEGKATRTRRNIYSVVKALFRDAKIEGVLPGQDPCILTHRQLGKVKDAPGFKRAEAVYTRDELAALISDPRLPLDRRAWYALLGIGMLRTGEAAGLRWGKVERVEPLGKIVIDTSYDHGRTKTEAPRWMPVHPALSAVLAEWRLSTGAPDPGDLVCPVTVEPPRKGKRKPAGSMRDRHYARKRLIKDLALLGFRHRRAHDLRRTGISLARSDGADKALLAWGTHAPPASVMDLYTTIEWEALCREVAKLRITKLGDGKGARVATNGHKRSRK